MNFITSVTYRRYQGRVYFGRRAFSRKSGGAASFRRRARSAGGFLRRSWLACFLLLLMAGGLRAESTGSCANLDDVFVWLAGGISSARIARLAGTVESTGGHQACRVTAGCIRALQKGGADPELIQELGVASRKNPAASSLGPAKTRGPRPQFRVAVALERWPTLPRWFTTRIGMRPKIRFEACYAVIPRTLAAFCAGNDLAQ